MSQYPATRDALVITNLREQNAAKLSTVRGSVTLTHALYMAVDAIKRLREIKTTGLIVVGCGGPTGAGKSTLANRICGMIDGSKVLCMRNYYRARRGSGGAKTLIYCDQNDDPGSININLMVEHLQALQLGETVCSPSFNFQSRQWSSSQVSPPQSRVLIVEGIYALNHKLRECYDLSIFVVGGIYFELLRQVHRHRMAGAIIGPSIASQIFPGIKEFVERDWKLAQLRVRNDVNEISSASADLRTQLCILKLRLTADQLAGLPEMITKVLDPGQHSLRRETYVDWFMVPPCVDIDNLGDDQFIKCRLLGSKCFVIASDRVVEGNFIINKRVDFEVSTATINGLKSLGYVITVSFKRTSTLYSDGKLTLSIDEIRELGQTFLQIKGERKSDLAAAAADLGLDMSADAETSSYCMLCQAANLGTTTVPRPVELSVDSETRSADATRTEVAVLSPEEGNRALSVLELLGLPGLHDDTESDNDEDGDSAARAGEEIELLADPGGKSDDAAASKASGALDSDAGPNSQPAESNGLPTPAFTEGLDRGESRFSSSPLSPLSSQRDVEEDKTEFDNCPPRPSIQRATRFL